MNRIISAFPGIGKTTLVQANKNYIDLESSDYKWLDIDKELSMEDLAMDPNEKIVLKHGEYLSDVVK